ncbi:hypothetical protein GCM10010435_26420 [Winogradskya consettensis]|uniref:OmpR/PhoB-type domain-containing protein n=1 Tax=Winogradskya consettensis TaxID=113560 RepID=A0A919SAG1_9ACTN|nr:AAA family ATPase [Actinoplanes consettensis]GIM68090.1 hypothetical protein Aco04nite_09210 [Actinoplanes consettensis]
MADNSGALRLRILGPLRAWHGDTELDLGPRQQAYVLALLLVHRNRPVGTAELIDLIWGHDVPASALNVLHKYIGSLRRVLEPGLPARASGSWLHRHGDGYLFAATSGMLDLAVFREQVEAAGAARGHDHDDTALGHYVQALALWHGRAGAGLTLTARAMATFAALDDEFYDACIAAAELAVSLGRPKQVLPALHLAASMTPLHEPVQAMLISTLGAAGNQAEALSVFQQVRSRLDQDLGVRPGPALQAAHWRVLTRAPQPAAAPRRPVTASGNPPAAGPRAVEPGPVEPGPVEPGTVEPGAVEPGAVEPGTVEPGAVEPGAVEPGAVEPGGGSSGIAGLVGRDEELAVLRQTVVSALAGRTAFGIVEGEPGVGKTSILREAAAEAERRGALVVRGACLDGAGTPSMWPWIQIINAVVDQLPPTAREKWLAGELGRLAEGGSDILATAVLPDNGTQFRLFEQVVAVLDDACAQRPVLLIIDDLQWADAGSLALLAHLAARMPRRSSILAALRDRAPLPGSELARMLAAASRVPGHRRLRLGPLGPGEVAELVRRETGADPDPETVRDIHTRTAGNPFFVRELSRLLTDDTVARSRVPSTVRDVVLDRMAGLDDTARDLLRTAAFIGRDVEIGVLARAAGLDVGACLARLEPVEALGMLEPRPDDPFSFRFAHDVVREALSESTPPGHATRLHLHVADALEAADPAGEYAAERLAHHLWSAGPLADPARTAGALTRAGRRAAGKSALETAERLLRSAAQLARTANLPELELAALSQLTAVVGMRSMYGFSSPDLLERAEQLSRDLGRHAEAAALLYSRWAAHNQALEYDRSAPLARRLLDQGEASGDPFVLACGLQAWGIHRWNLGDIGEAYRCLSRSRPTILALGRREDDPVRHDLQLLMTGMLAELTAMHQDVDQARALLDTLEAAAGDDPYLITIWATFADRIAALVDDPARALRAAERGLAVDPGFSFVFLGTYQRLARCWARATTGVDPAGAAAEAAEIIAANLLGPARSCVSTWFGLLGEMHLAAGALDEAAAALDRAGGYLDEYSQRYSEGLILLIRARLLRARGEPVTVVRAAAERAQRLSSERGAHLFARRTQAFLRELG